MPNCKNYIILSLCLVPRRIVLDSRFLRKYLKLHTVAYIWTWKVNIVMAGRDTIANTQYISFDVWAQW